MQHLLEDHPYIREILAFEKQFPEREDFHQRAEPLLQKMGADDEFLRLVLQRNFQDAGYLSQQWSLYNIPFLYIYETADFNLKIHFFPGMKNYVQGTAAHCIHHHNNYILTTAAIYGPGYEAMLFDKQVEMDPYTFRTRLKLDRHFSQSEFPIHRVGAWQPHLVFNPASFSATLQLWTPDQKRATDNLRTNPLLKAFKMPIRKIIYLLGMENRVGIAAKETYQYYPDGSQFMAIEEDAYFEPTRRAIGPEVDHYSMQTVFYFIQKRHLYNDEFIKAVKNNSQTPAYYLPFIDMLIQGQDIPATYCKETINIPSRAYMIADVMEALNG